MSSSRLQSPAWVCLPTYNERENLEPMIEALSAVLDTASDRVLVIDDSSPDGTGLLASDLAARHEWVEVLHREKKEGLGPAYIAGFRHALAQGAQLVIEMDCDFSHDPSSVPRLIAACEAGADLALGSRYVEGGSVADWGTGRRIVSRAGSAYARTLLGVPIRDLTGGFKCFRRRVLETLDLDSIGSKGYSFQIEGTYRAIRAGFDVVEVPIRFSDRRVGSSKMTTGIVIEAMLQVPALRWQLRRSRAAAVRANDGRRVNHSDSSEHTRRT